MCVVRDARDVGGDGGDGGQLLVPAAVDRFAGQGERGHRRGHELLGPLGLRAAGVGDASGLRDQRGVEQPAPGQESFDASAQVRGEEARVGSGEHRGEHPERVAVQLIRVDRAERCGHHRHGRRGVAQVVEPDRVHAEGRKQVGDIGEFARIADADRAVAFGGHPLRPDVARVSR